MIYSFSGGIKPPVTGRAEPFTLVPAPMPETVRIAPSPACAGYKPQIRKGDAVFVGTLLFSHPDSGKTPLFSPVSGTAEEVSEACVVLRSDYAETPSPQLLPFSGSVRDTDPAELISVVARCGVPYQGAENALSAFLPAYRGKLRHVLLNLSETDPRSVSRAITASCYAEEILDGMKLLLRMLGVRQADILVPADDPALLSLLRRQANGSPFFAFHKITPKYPASDPRLAAALLCGKTPDPARPVSDSGIAVFTPDVPLAVCRAFALGMPAVTRVVTVFGDCVRKPVVFEAPVGMRFCDLLEASGSLCRKPVILTSGSGTLCGECEESFEGSVRADTSEVCVNSAAVPGMKPKMGGGSCNGCGRCDDICPVGLLPDRLLAVGCRMAEEAVLIRDGKKDSAPFRALLAECTAFDAFACLGCGCCTYVCPAGLDVKSGVVRLRYLILKGDKPDV